MVVETRRSLGRNSSGNLQEPEIRNIVTDIAARAYANQFDFRHYKSIPTGMLAHTSLQMCKTIEILDLSMRRFIAHSRIPPVKALDYAYKSAAWESRTRRFRVTDVVG